MLIVVRSVLYISRVLRTLVSDYDLFVQHIKFMCNICKLIYLTVVIFFYIIAYFWFVNHICFERVEEFKYLGTTLTNQNSILEEIKSRLRSGNACYHSVQNLLSSRLLS